MKFVAMHQNFLNNVVYYNYADDLMIIIQPMILNLCYALEEVIF